MFSTILSAIFSILHSFLSLSPSLSLPLLNFPTFLYFPFQNTSIILFFPLEQLLTLFSMVSFYFLVSILTLGYKHSHKDLKLGSQKNRKYVAFLFMNLVTSAVTCMTIMMSSTGRYRQVCNNGTYICGITNSYVIESMFNRRQLTRGTIKFKE